MTAGLSSWPGECQRGELNWRRRRRGGGRRWVGRSDKPSPTHPNDQIHHSTKLHKLHPLPLPEAGGGRLPLPHFCYWKFEMWSKTKAACAPRWAVVSFNFKPLRGTGEFLCVGWGDGGWGGRASRRRRLCTRRGRSGALGSAAAVLGTCAPPASRTGSASPVSIVLPASPTWVLAPRKRVWALKTLHLYGPPPPLLLVTKDCRRSGVRREAVGSYYPPKVWPVPGCPAAHSVITGRSRWKRTPF